MFDTTLILLPLGGTWWELDDYYVSTTPHSVDVSGYTSSLGFSGLLGIQFVPIDDLIRLSFGLGAVMSTWGLSKLTGASASGNEYEYDFSDFNSGAGARAGVSIHLSPSMLLSFTITGTYYFWRIVVAGPYGYSISPSLGISFTL